ncbi:histone-lysine N-methyltransferase, H3 lysine-79 specific-like isoform X2 [Aricia agestis]|uniref:histone-lysine N-methyltransferase, H3 lysine-79 specific-like isoform X2 n=1 Tax=Aricia agestis TaxID=91739 RepID=UPI001C2090DC|nr:histone-lysine N-methyltransferase, H3 lysine-79 specific-like isoform X2 [Aricia agestis]
MKVLSRTTPTEQTEKSYELKIVASVSHGPRSLTLSWNENTESAEIGKNKECQRHYSEQNRKKSKLNEAERRKRIQCLKDIAEYCRVELNVENIIDTNSQSSSDLDGTQEIIQESEQTSLCGISSLNEKSNQGSEQMPHILLSQTEESIDGCEQKIFNGSLCTNENSSQNEPTKKKDALLKLQRKRERQQRYREQNREKLKKREAERRKRKQCLQNIAAYLKVELNDEDKSETTLNIEGSRLSYIERRMESKLEKNRERQKRYRERKKEKLKQLKAECLQSPEIIAELLRENNKKKEWQQRYREKNREKLRQREKERRKRVQCLQKIAEICKLELDDQGVLESNVQSSSASEQSGLGQFGEFGLDHFAFKFDMQKVLTQPPDALNEIPTM